ncbi:glutamate--tRNA ligase [Candidatus Saccharibacteria bacterium]|nr:glutamate--tRNA ligase [Candidatus Saccharibacteria bacterium]
MKVRTRFAPSPTGFLHVGGVRTALFAWLVAHQSDGQFILRIEDTDKAREVAGSEDHIKESLDWLGLDWDEEPSRQSDRLEIYRSYAQKLVESGRAYADPYTPEQLDELRQKAKIEKRPFLFRDHRPDNPPSWDGSLPLRFKSDPISYRWHDEVMGELSTGPEVVDDFILIKSDGYPTYNFAHIVDDHEMGITHVIRSQEFLSSMPKFINLYDALGIKWRENIKFATLPYVLGPDGKKKLSKRDGAKDILDYRKEGYLPEALVSFLATLGWNDGTEQEIFTIDELTQKFSLDRVQHSGAKFDEQRLLWINGHFIRELPIDELYKRAEGFWPEAAQSAEDNYKKKVLGLVQERLKYLSELPELTNFFFEDLPADLELINQNKQLNKFGRDELTDLLKKTTEKLGTSDFSVDDVTKRLNQMLEDFDQKPGILFSLIRIATTWAPASPGLAETLHVLGKDKSLERIKQSIAALAD